MGVFESARFVRFATLLAVALVLLLSGVVVGAAGGPVIMGAANSAGVTNTSLTTTSTGTALLVTQTGSGTALRGSATGPGSIAGFFTAANGTGISGVTGAPGSYGVFAQNNGAFGSGGAVRASGGNNSGVVATTSGAGADAVRAINTGGGQALDLVVNADVPPMSVNSDGLVTNLNADQLDGMDSGAFLPADDYAVMQLGPWHVFLGSAVTIVYGASENSVQSAASGLRQVQLALDGPAMVGGIAYGFESARLCFAASAGVTIQTTYVTQATDTSFTNLVLDGTDRPMEPAACYTITDGDPDLAVGGTSLVLDLQYASAATALLKSVTTTWTPVSP